MTRCAIITIVSAWALIECAVALPLFQDSQQNPTSQIPDDVNEWVGKRCPLLELWDGGDRVARGRWLILLAILGAPVAATLSRGLSDSQGNW